MAEKENNNNNHSKSKSWVQIAATVAGAIVVGMQGVNFAEISHGNENGEKRMELLQQLLSISKSMDESLKNQNRMLDHDAQSFQNQQQILETLTKAINERRDILLRDLQKQQENK